MQTVVHLSWHIETKHTHALAECRRLIAQSGGQLTEVQFEETLIGIRGVLSADDPLFEALRRLSEQYRLRGFNTLFQAQYTKQEIDQAELLHLSATNYVTHTPPEVSGTIYEDITICNQCRLHRREQRSPLHLSSAKLSGLKISKTYGDDTYVISEELANLFREWNVTGCRLDDVTNSKGALLNMKQLVPTWVLPDLAESTPFVTDDVCPACGRFGTFPLQLHYDRAKLGDIHDVGFAPVFYSMNRFTEAYRIISRRLYQLMKQAKVKGFRVTPVWIND